MYELVKYYFSDLPKEEWIAKAQELRKEADEAGVRLFGAIYHITDGDDLGPNTCGLDFSDHNGKKIRPIN
eukprot:TRINITY_DN3868_c0_g1_i1.p3 TRINITY_DN3868_c0_g1~~TRINITY_DN3868_c0_g1_i1.p3  ORF type:complete len:70 (-),score=13.68 TRINITY_DN3868_c0_g1_i1:830-1039(-)